MISSTVLLPFLIIQFSVAFSPGLIIALVVNQSVQNSRRKGIEVGIGAAVGAIGITLVSAIVVSLLVNTVPVMINIIYFIGSIYIILKGYQTITSDTGTKENIADNSAFLSGFQVNLLNPKMWVFLSHCVTHLHVRRNKLFCQLNLSWSYNPSDKFHCRYYLCFY